MKGYWLSTTALLTLPELCERIDVLEYSNYEISLTIIDQATRTIDVENGEIVVPFSGKYRLRLYKGEVTTDERGNIYTNISFSTLLSRLDFPPHPDRFVIHDYCLSYSPFATSEDRRRPNRRERRKKK